MKLINEKLSVAEYKYPYYKKLNPLLNLYISSLPNAPDHPNNVVAKMTVRNLKTPELDKLVRWIKQIVSSDFIGRTSNSDLYRINGWQWDLECKELWGVEYKKGDFITDHTHAPYVFAFTYIVNSPKGSPPLIFSTSGHRVKSEEGKLILWDARLIHKVPPAKVDGRCIIAGTFANVLSSNVPSNFVRL
tara:strand:- start:57 stop:623 length:567 start_codon:yes stop_codon:yes gene_type:complete